MDHQGNVATMATSPASRPQSVPLKRNATDSNAQARPQALKKTKRARRDDRRSPAAFAPTLASPPYRQAGTTLAFPPHLSTPLPPFQPSLPPPLWTAVHPPGYSWAAMSPVHHNHMLYNHYLQGFQLPAFQNGSWAVPSAVPSALPALSPLPLRQEGADSAAADAKAEMQRVDSSTHINSLVAQYSFAQAGAAAAAAAAAAACAGSPVSPSQLVSPRTGWPHFAACPPFMGPMGPVSYAPGFGTIRSPKPAEGSASAGGSSSSHLPSLLESPLQSEVLPAESDGESCCKIELPTEQMDGEGETEADESRRLLFPSEQPATDGGAEGAEKAEQDLRVTKGTRAMQLWLEGGAEGDVQGMGPFDWLDEPSGAEEATGLPHWVLAELGEGGAGKKSGEAVEEEVYRVLFRADSMESATSEQHVTTPLHETPLQAHEAKDEQYEDESTPTGTNKAVTGTPAGEEQGLNTVSNAGSADFGTTSIGDLVLGGLVDKPSAQVLEDSSTEDIWHDVSALSDFLAASSSPIVDSELCLELQDVPDWQF